MHRGFRITALFGEIGGKRLHLSCWSTQCLLVCAPDSAENGWCVMLWHRQSLIKDHVKISVFSCDLALSLTVLYLEYHGEKIDSQELQRRQELLNFL